MCYKTILLGIKLRRFVLRNFNYHTFVGISSPFFFFFFCVCKFIWGKSHNRRRYLQHLHRQLKYVDSVTSSAILFCKKYITCHYVRCAGGMFTCVVKGLWFLRQHSSCCLCQRCYWIAVSISWRTSKKSGLRALLWNRSELVLCDTTGIVWSSCEMFLSHLVEREGARKRQSSLLLFAHVNASANRKGSTHPSCGHLCLCQSSNPLCPFALNKSVTDAQHIFV